MLGSQSYSSGTRLGQVDMFVMQFVGQLEVHQMMIYEYELSEKIFINIKKYINKKKII